MNGTKKFHARMGIGFPLPFLCVLLLFSCMVALGQIRDVSSETTLGQILVNSFGGCNWMEEIDLQYIISWMMLYIPAGISASIVLANRTSGFMRMEGYRYGKVLRWYASLVGQVMLTVGVVMLTQVLFVVVAALCSGHTGIGIWVNDADQFLVQNTVRSALTPVLFVLYGEVITLLASVVFLVFRNMTWYFVALMLPSLLGAACCSRLTRSSLFNPLHWGMSLRLSVEGCSGVAPALAAGGLVAVCAILIVIGGVYCCLTAPFDCASET